VKNGVKLSYEQYPYTAGSTFLSSLFPPWVHEGGVNMLLNRLKDKKIRSKIASEYRERVAGGRVTSWDKLMLTYVSSSENKDLEGLTIEEIAQKKGRNEVDVLIDLVIGEENQASMASFIISEEDVERIMAHPLGTICTDGLLLGKPHPRTYGSFPRVLGRYVRKEVVNLVEAVRKMTSYPAKIFGLKKRGRIKPGFYADVTIFDPDKIEDTATYQNPISYPKGITHVIVNGRIIVNNGMFSYKKAGKILK
jgi:N-acyl-D-amino-acid deacylase